MRIDTEDLRRHYESLSDEGILDIDRSKLTPVAQGIYDQEVARRELDQLPEEEEGGDRCHRHLPVFKPGVANELGGDGHDGRPRTRMEAGGFMGASRYSLATIRSNLRVYLVCNTAYYLGMLIASFYVAAHPSLQHKLLTALSVDLKHGLLSYVARAYMSGNVAAAAVGTFLVNSIIGAFIEITLPSFLIPFSGVATGLYRAVLWGLMMAPTNRAIFLAMIPHSLCLLLEGQGYVLAMFGCCLWGKWLIHPSRAGFSSAREAYVAGVGVNLRLYALILPVLAVAAVYESAELIAIKALLGR